MIDLLGERLSVAWWEEEESRKGEGEVSFVKWGVAELRLPSSLYSGSLTHVSVGMVTR